MNNNKLKTYLINSDNEILIENKLIVEFSNIDPRSHKFGVNVKLHLFQPEDTKMLKHGPRLKVFKNKPGPDFTVTLEKNPRVIGDSTKVVSSSELTIILKNVKKYRSAFIDFWNTEGMTTDELRDLMDEIDNIELKKGTN